MVKIWLKYVYIFTVHVCATMKQKSSWASEEDAWSERITVQAWLHAWRDGKLSRAGRQTGWCGHWAMRGRPLFSGLRLVFHVDRVGDMAAMTQQLSRALPHSTLRSPFIGYLRSVNCLPTHNAQRCNCHARFKRQACVTVEPTSDQNLDHPLT